MSNKTASGVSSGLQMAYPMCPTSAAEFRKFLKEMEAFRHPMEATELDHAAAEFADKKRAILHRQLVACLSALIGVMRGPCWCTGLLEPVGLTHPNYTGHTIQCEIAQRVWQATSVTLQEE